MFWASLASSVSLVSPLCFLGLFPIEISQNLSAFSGSIFWEIRTKRLSLTLTTAKQGPLSHKKSWLKNLLFMAPQ